MADISRELQAIMNAIYGEEVRGSIHDAIDLINKVGEVVLSAGTAITGPTSSTTGFYKGSFYLNSQTDDLWKCTGPGWTLAGNLRGSNIASISLYSTDVLTDTYKVTLTNGVSTYFNVTNGRSISNISKKTTSGLVDTYEITYNDNSTSTFDVKNGYSPTVQVSKQGKVTTVVITDETGPHTFQVLDGADGDMATLAEMGDVQISNPLPRQFLRWDSTLEKWVNMSAGDLNGYNVEICEADYMALKEQYPDPEQHQGVYDPNIYYYIYNMNEEGWVETDWLTAISGVTELTFDATTIRSDDARSIHKRSLIKIEAETTSSMTQSGDNPVKPVYARVKVQNEGSCKITFDNPGADTTYFKLWIRNE